MITQPVQALHVHGLEKSYDGLTMFAATFAERVAIARVSSANRWP